MKNFKYLLICHHINISYILQVNINNIFLWKITIFKTKIISVRKMAFFLYFCNSLYTWLIKDSWTLSSPPLFNLLWHHISCCLWEIPLYTHEKKANNHSSCTLTPAVYASPLVLSVLCICLASNGSDLQNTSWKDLSSYHCCWDSCNCLSSLQKILC